MSGTTIKFLRLRLLLDDLYSCSRGWYHRIARRPALAPRDLPYDSILSDVSLDINWREELKEINHSRIHNMGLGCELVNRVLLKPGEIFSLRRLLGSASEAQGFQRGPMFIRGRTDYVTGGGICLVSTLLFNAALQANLDILEKHNHSTDLWGEDRFIGLGLDATYVFGRKDLKFRNTHEEDIVLALDISREALKLNCRVLSVKPSLHQVEVTTEILEELKPEQGENQGKRSEERPYRKGWIVMTKRHVQLHPDWEAQTNYVKKEKYKPYHLPTAAGQE